MCFDKHAVQEHVLFLSTILAIVVEVTHQGKHFSFGQAKYNGDVIDPFLGILVAMVFISKVKLRRPVSQFQAIA